MGKITTPAQGGAGKKKADEFMRLTQALLVQKKPGTIEVEVQPEQVQQAIERSFKDYLFDTSVQVERPDFRFTCGGVGIVPSGGIIAVCGEAKQGKTQFLVALAAVMMSGRPFGSMKRETPPASFLWVDTEQSPYEVQTCMGRLYHLADIPEGTPSADIGLNILALCDCDPGERVKYMQEAINELDPDVIIIDGVRDLLDDFNDVTQSNEVVGRLLKNKKDGRNIFTILHTNVGTSKMRGHLGTELTNKCSDIFTIKKVGDHFEARHTSRHQPMPGTFSFKFDTDGNLVPVDDLNTDTQAPGIAGDPDKALEAIFEGGKKMLYAKVRSEFAKRVGITQKEAAEYIKQHYIGTRLLQDNEGLWYLAFFKFS